MTSHSYDLVVIGAGPGGYVAAIRAAQLGMSVACVDENTDFGGTCLRVGCIPSKVMLESSERYFETKNHLASHGVIVGKVELDLDTMQQRRKKVIQTSAMGVSSLLKHNGVAAHVGRAKLDGPGRVVVTGESGEQLLETKNILIATGSRPTTLPHVQPDGDRIGTSTEALAYTSVPKHLVVIGAGYIGLELGSVWNRLGSKVTVLEALDRILPGMDDELAKSAKRIFEKQGLSFRLSTKVKRATAKRRECVVECDDGEVIKCDRVLLSIGRVANTEGLGLETVGLKLDQRGEISVNDSFETDAAGVFAIGDVIRGPKLAHKASHEALACVQMMHGDYGHVNYETIPGVVYTHPEIATIGRTEQQLQEAGVEYRRGTFPFQASGRARTLEQTDGMVKILADAATDRILGVHILGPRAGDLIAEAGVAIELGASAEDLTHICHAHPTLAESVAEAALDVDERAIHMVTRRRR